MKKLMILGTVVMMLFSSCKQKDYKVYQVSVDDYHIIIFDETIDEAMLKIEEVFPKSSYIIADISKFPEYTLTTVEYNEYIK